MVYHLLISAAIALLPSSGNQERVVSIGLEKIANILRGDVRLIAMGDSYSSPFFGRVPLASLRVWPIQNISAICGGAAKTTHLFSCSSQCEPVSLIQAEDTLGYTIERNSPESFFTFPTLGLQEIYTSNTFDDQGTDNLFTFSFNEIGYTYLLDGVHGKFSEQGDGVHFRFLYRCPFSNTNQIEQVKVLDNTQEVGAINLRNGARPLWHQGENPILGTRDAVPNQINASAQDFPAQNDTNGLLTMRLAQTEPLQGTNQYFEPAGCVYYHSDNNGAREQGLYYSYIADGSWSYSGFGCDTEGSDVFDKRFSLEQFTHWFDVTTLDRLQTTVFMWFLAPEQLSYNTAMSRMTDMIDQVNASADLIGISNVEHLIVIGSLFNLTNDVALTKEYIRNQQEAAFDLATIRSNVAAASLFAATDEVMFDGAAGIPWLLYHGFDQFDIGPTTIDLVENTGGNLFDIWGIHPSSTNAAAFFAALLGEMIRDAGCQADIVVDGYINTTDLLAVLSRIGEEYVKEDINEDGIVDVLDILLVIDGWGECWPVQAPFNTPAFRSR